jgi:hypothetical protein
MAKEYDLVKVKFGYNEYAMSKKSALMLFEIMSTQEVWKLDSTWINSESRMKAAPIDHAHHISIQGLNPVQFHMAVEYERQLQEEKDAKERAKANAGNA